MLKTIFFDAAGTLFESRNPIGDSYAAVARNFGANVAGKKVSAAFRRAFASAHGLAFGPGRPAGEIRRLEREWWRARVAETFADLHQFDDFDAYFNALFEFFGDPVNWAAYPDVVPALEQLKALGLRMGVVSNFDARLYRLLEGLGLTRFFESVTISSEAGYAKPARQLFEAALARMGVAASEAVHVGDAPHLDVTGANAAGIEAILIRRDQHASVADSSGPASGTVITSFDQLVAIVRTRI